MTPLAYRIVKDMMLLVKQRQVHLEPELLAQFREEFHCFEVTAIKQLSWCLRSQMLRSFQPSIAGAFLPAERTWLEWSGDGSLGVKRSRIAEPDRHLHREERLK